jgi:cytosine deaminase
MSPQPRGLTRVKELLGRGINVVAASDHVNDAFNPLGNYDLLQTANLTAQAAQLTGTRELDTCLNMIGSKAAELMGLSGYGLFEGARADLVVINARGLHAALATVPERLATFRNGQLAVRSDLRRIWKDQLLRA